MVVTNPNDRVVFTGSTLAKASLVVPGLTHVFPFNPDTVQWNYQENIVSMDTLGGRVVQLLSIQLSGLTLTARAGSRAELQRMATNIKSIMGFHTNTLEPARLKVPSRNWDFLVYLAEVPQLGWDYTSTSYPYQMIFAVEDDLTGVKTKQISNSVIDKIRKDIGYNENAHGGTLEEAGQFYDIVDALSKPIATSATGSSSINAPGQATEAAKAWIAALNENFTWTNMGVCDCRSTNNGTGSSSTPSQHSYCNAVDAGGSQDTMQAIADFAVTNAAQYSIHTIIYNHQSHSATGSWQPYTCSGTTGCHEDHVHVDFDPQGSGPCTTG